MKIVFQVNYIGTYFKLYMEFLVTSADLSSEFPFSKYITLL